MAVHGDLQGQGLGGELLRHVLSGAATAPAPVVLTTHKLVNVCFYERAGFRVAREESVQLPDTPAYPVWGMRREPS
ncbi:MAG TPA: GNAT family N-acetyltransferase, partial [Polyangiaceae bacterium]|nr:GNAT family N-acetyltransferase [Polyangiaceae bacterium]